VAAAELQPQADVLFPAFPGSIDAYVHLTLTDDDDHVSKRRTHTIQRSRNPVWREAFKFGVHKKAKTLVLLAEVFSEEAAPRDDTFLGSLRLEFEKEKLEQEENVWWTVSRELDGGEKRRNEAVGSIHLRLCWEPWRTRQVSKLLCALCSSPKAVSVAGTVQVFFACSLALVEWHMRWLCTGDILADCTEVEVPGAALCAVLACLALFASGVIQLAGSLDMLGKDWNGAPPHAFELLEDPDEEGEFLSHDSETGGTMHISIKPHAHHYRAYIGIKELRLCGCRVGLVFLRYLAWSLKASALGFCLLGALLADLF